MSQQETGVRKASISRETLETQIAVELCLDGTGQCTLDTGLPFLEHMLDQIARHGQVDLDIQPRATCTSMPTTRWKISASHWAGV